MKTALQEWIEWLKAYEYELPLELQIKAKELLKKEKEQIIDAYYGKINGVFGYRGEGQEYYNQTFNQNK